MGLGTGRDEIVYQWAMSVHRLVYSFLIGVLLLALPRDARAQHEHAEDRGLRLAWRAHAIGVVTRVQPGALGRDLTEGYLTQPHLSLHAAFGDFAFAGMLNLEGLTLERGELNHGVWGEGYVDRRHPHTYLHEAVLTWSPQLFGNAVSLSAGRGFAPFGTDDPMVRGFVKYPSNHHLSQILERQLVVGAVRRAGLIVEGGVFNGDEPISPGDFGRSERFGDSWSVRATLLPTEWLELQGSYAEVESPEQPFGGGLNHKLWNVSARVSATRGRQTLYGLAEVGHTGEFTGEIEAFRFNTALAEAAWGYDDWRVAARFEQSDRPEEERVVEGFPFRSVRPAADNNILGTTRWRIGTIQLSRTWSLRTLRLQPLIEVARLAADPNEKPALIDPASIYGSATLWSFSAGVRTSLGLSHTRMGRYGVAAATH